MTKPLSFPHKQRGIGLFGIAFVVGVIVIAAIVGLKLIPIFMENGKIMKSVSQLKNVNGVEEMSGAQAKSHMVNLLYLNDVEQKVRTDYEKYFKFKAGEKGGKAMYVKYEREALLFHNVYFLVKFEDVVEFL